MLPSEDDCAREEPPVSMQAAGMDHYVGCKIVAAKPMDECAFLAAFRNEDVANRETRPGYLVIYPDGYKSWSPKNVFDTCYRKVTVDEYDLLT